MTNLTGNILKNYAAHLPPPPRTIIKRSVLQAEQTAARIRAAAEADAAAMRAAARLEAEELLARTERETRERCLAELTDDLLAARQERDAALAQVERDVLKLSLRIAEKIIGRELEQRPDTIADIIATAIRYARQHEILTVRICPTDVPHVEQHRSRIEATGRARFIDFVPDPRIARGGCVIESESGTVDAELETQLRVIEQALLARTNSG